MLVKIIRVYSRPIALAFAAASLAACTATDEGTSSSLAASTSSEMVVSSSVATQSSSSVALSSSSLLSSSLPTSSSQSSNAAISTVTLEESSPQGFCGYEGKVETEHAGYLGSGFINSDNATGASIRWQVNAEVAGTATVGVRYAHAGANARSATLSAQEAGASVGMMFNATAAWTDWQTEQVVVDLVQGANTVTLSASTNEGLANIDSISLSGMGISAGSCSGLASSSSAANTSSVSSASSMGSTDAIAAEVYYPTKGRTNTCADAAVGIQFNREPVINSGGKIEIRDASGALFDSVTSNVDSGAGLFSSLTSRVSGGKTFKSDVLYVVGNTVMFHPKGNLAFGTTYFVTISEGMISDTSGNPFSVNTGDSWSFTVRGQKPATATNYAVAADGSGEYCTIVGLLEDIPATSNTTRTIAIKSGVYPGVVMLTSSNIHFKGEGREATILAPKNSAKMTGSGTRDRMGYYLNASDITFEDLTLFNTFPKISGGGRQAEAIHIDKNAQRIFFNNVHLRSHQDTLLVNAGSQVYMKNGKISGGVDYVWGAGAFYCENCELSNRGTGSITNSRTPTDGNGLAFVNCTMTRESSDLKGITLGQTHGKTTGNTAFINCKIDDHIVGWRDTAERYWEYDNTRLNSGEPVTFEGTQISAGDANWQKLQSAQSWLGWAP